MLNKFIERPVLSTVISILIVILGLVGLKSLPIMQYPNIAPPMIKVTANYPGANADVVLNSVIAPLEEQINGVEGMSYISSYARNDGSAEINVYFNLGVDPDMACVFVQNKVSAAASNLPSAVTQMGVTTKKVQNSMVLVLAIYSENPDHDETFIQNYTRINILPDIQRTTGVGDVSVFGSKTYSIRVWLKPEKLTTYNLQPSDISAAISEQSQEVAPGKIGSNSDQVFEYTIKYKGRLNTAKDFENIIIKASESGEILRLKDVAKIEFGAFDYSVKSQAQGYPGAIMAIYQTNGSNLSQIVSDIKTKVSLSETSFPKGLKYQYVIDSTDFLNASIHEVIKTLYEAFILVFIVVFIFLQNIRSTLIPAISAFVAIIGTFFFLTLFGYSINLLTLFALVLSIGIVVDDAIVVVEAVHAKLEQENMTTMEATKSAMSEINTAIISITLVFMATFLPVTFMSGSAGVFYKQFAITLSCAMLLSALNALTLSPALCVLLIKPHHENVTEKKNIFKKFSMAFNASFEHLTNKYTRIVSYFTNHKIVVCSSFIIILIFAFILMSRTPSGFIPTEDQGQIFMDISMAEGSTLERSSAVLSEIDSVLSTMPVIESRLNVAGTSMISGAYGGSYGMVMAKLIPWENRDTTSLNNIIKEINTKCSFIKDASIVTFVPPTVSGFGNSDGFEFQLKDASGSGDLKNMYEVGQSFIQNLNKRPEISYAMSSFSVNFPQLEMIVDINKCKMIGVNVSDVFNAISGYIGGSVVGNFNRFTKYYRVMMQSEAKDRKSITDLNKMTVRNDQNKMVPLTSLIELKRVYGSELIKRYNLYNAMTITGQPNTGYSSGNAIAAIQDEADNLPNGYGIEFTSLSKDELESSGEQAFIFFLSIILVYFILCGLYESYILPFAVILSLGLSVIGVFITINLVGLAIPAINNNIYVQIALIMLLGLLAKNAILIVEFAKQTHEEGLCIKEAAVNAAKARLRPILMTSFAFVFGMLPLCLSNGAGAVGNMSIGFAAGGGFLIATLIGIFVIPIFYIVFQTLQEKISENKEITKKL